MKSSTVNSPDMQIIQLDIKQLSKISSGANPHQQLVALERPNLDITGQAID